MRMLVAHFYGNAMEAAGSCLAALLTGHSISNAACRGTDIYRAALTNAVQQVAETCGWGCVHGMEMNGMLLTL
jgi:hypothetical protein